MSFPKGWKYRPMKTTDIPVALAIIELHDEDDREWAEETYQNRGVHGQYVLTFQKQVWGVTGFAPADGISDVFWISWTYLHPEQQGQGLGKGMVDEVLTHLRKLKARKVFVSTSDYVEDGQPIYSDAIKVYEACGFRQEIRHYDYYGPGEAELIYGLDLRDTQALLNQAPPPVEEMERGTAGIVLEDPFPIDETEGAYAINWEYSEDGSQFTAEDLQQCIDHLKSYQARAAFISFPSDHTQFEALLKEKGFFEAGKLLDFFRDSLHEVHYRLDLTKLT